MANRRVNTSTYGYDRFRRPCSQFCGTFGGTDGQSSYDWLRKFEYKHQSYLTARMYPRDTYLHCGDAVG